MQAMVVPLDKSPTGNQFCSDSHGRARHFVLQVDQMGKHHTIAACLRSILSMAFVLFAMNASSLLAQLTIPQTLEGPADGVPDPVASEWPGPTPGYWIVSTWTAPQKFNSASPGFCDSVDRYDEGIGYRRSSLGELSQSLIPGVPVCIVVHGSFMDSPSVIPESCSTWQGLKAGSCGQPFQMIYFSWPSDRPISPLASIDVAVLGKRAARNGFYLASLIQHIPPECPVSLFGHSHGTRVVASALHLMAGGVVEGCGHPFARSAGRRIRTVFAASAIDHDWLNPGQHFDRALCSTECLLNLRNNHDPALMIYPLRCIGSSRALGFSGFTAKDHQRLGPLNCRVRELDVSSQIGAGHVWPNYVSRVWLVRTIGNYIYFSDLRSSTLQATAAISR